MATSNICGVNILYKESIMPKRKTNVIVIDENVRTRAYEKYRSKGRYLAQKLRWKKLIQNQNILHTNIRLTVLQFYITASYMQLDVNYLYCTFLAIHKTTPITALCGSIFLSVMYNLPCMMLYLFIGKYVRCGFIKFWDFIPILKGAGYSTVFVALLHEIYVLSIAVLLIKILIDIFIFGTDFTRCEFAKGTTYYAGCIASNPVYRINYTKPACSPIYHPSPTLYARLMYRKAFHWWSDDYYLQPDFTIIAIVIFLWSIILLISYQGCQRFIKTTSLITLILVLLFLLVTIITIFIPGMGLYKRNWVSSAHSFDMKIIANILAFSVLCNMPATSIFLGAICPKSTDAGRASILLIFLKLIVTTYLITWINVILNVLNNDYQLGYFDECSDFSVFTYVVGMMADAISRAILGKFLVFVYYVIMIICTIISMIIVTVSSVESLIQQLSANLKRFRFLIFAGYVFVACILHLIIITADLMFSRHISIIYLMGFYTICTFLANVTVTFIYSIARLCNDYFFLCGHRPLEFWSLLLRICPLLLMFCSVLIIIQLEAIVFPPTMMQMSITALHVMCAGFYTPLIIYMLWIIYRYFHSHKKTPILMPEDTWGPYSEKLRERRKKFFPERDLKYLSHVPRCKHKCLIGSEEYVKEVDEQIRKLHDFVNRLKRKHNVD